MCSCDWRIAAGIKRLFVCAQSVIHDDVLHWCYSLTLRHVTGVECCAGQDSLDSEGSGLELVLAQSDVCLCCHDVMLCSCSQWNLNALTPKYFVLNRCLLAAVVLRFSDEQINSSAKSSGGWKYILVKNYHLLHLGLQQIIICIDSSND